jgi:hypothetical protein
MQELKAIFLEITDSTNCSYGIKINNRMKTDNHTGIKEYN